MKTQDT